MKADLKNLRGWFTHGYHKQIQSVSLTILFDRDCWHSRTCGIRRFKGTLSVYVGPIVLEVGA